MKGILDTSVVVASGVSLLPNESAISAATLAELHFGVHLAQSDEERRRRLYRLAAIESSFDALPIDERVSRSYGLLAATVVGAGMKPRARVMDLLIAATAHAHHAAIFTRDPRGFAGLEELVEVNVV